MIRHVRGREGGGKECGQNDRQEDKREDGIERDSQREVHSK